MPDVDKAKPCPFCGSAGMLTKAKYSELNSSKLPWKYSADECKVLDADGRLVVKDVWGNCESQCDINAKLIVTAVNSHQLLVDALKKISEANYDDYLEYLDIVEAYEEIAKTALKSAREK